ncbi:NUDIX hydrolase [uncultured Paracoccus sp.]|uniref:NUDIX domain-containing protein n=1 Tax=uncultured Paracoccus sp. TaxID=189685 RepID=UPI00262F74CC|nr:NUDIX hydrolase [uncultured Paracoccus sp.]
MARPRLAVRAAILHRDRLLLVNAYPGQESDLWALPGGGVEPGQSLPENLIREVGEETGLAITVGAPFLVNEFHDPASGFHQVELFFRAELAGGDAVRLEDPEGVVNRFRWVSRNELSGLRHKPDSLGAAVWGEASAIYDPLERIVL